MRSTGDHDPVYVGYTHLAGAVYIIVCCGGRVTWRRVNAMPEA